MEEKATQRGESAYTTWSVEKDSVQGRGFPYREEKKCVVDFRTQSLCLLRMDYAVWAVLKPVGTG